MHVNRLFLVITLTGLLFASTPSHAGLGGVGVGWFTQNPLVNAVSRGSDLACSAGSGLYRAGGAILGAISSCKLKSMVRFTAVTSLLMLNPAEAACCPSLTPRNLDRAMNVMTAGAIALSTTQLYSIGGAAWETYGYYSEYSEEVESQQIILDDPVEKFVAVLFHPEYWAGGEWDKAIKDFTNNDRDYIAILNMGEKKARINIEQHPDKVAEALDYVYGQVINRQRRQGRTDIPSQDEFFSPRLLAEKQSKWDSYMGGLYSIRNYVFLAVAAEAMRQGLRLSHNYLSRALQHLRQGRRHGLPANAGLRISQLRAAAAAALAAPGLTSAQRAARLARRAASGISANPLRGISSLFRIGIGQSGHAYAAAAAAAAPAAAPAVAAGPAAGVALQPQPLLALTAWNKVRTNNDLYQFITSNPGLSIVKTVGKRVKHPWKIHIQIPGQRRPIRIGTSANSDQLGGIVQQQVRMYLKQIRQKTGNN